MQTMQPQQLDQATTQARQYYEQLAGIPQQQIQQPIAAVPPVTQFFNPRAPEAPQAQQQIALLMQSSEQTLQLLGGISQAINTQANQSTHHAQWLEHLIKRLDTTDRRLDRAITTANIAIIGLIAVTLTSLTFTFWPKSDKVSIVPPDSIARLS